HPHHQRPPRGGGLGRAVLPGVVPRRRPVVLHAAQAQLQQRVARRVGALGRRARGPRRARLSRASRRADPPRRWRRARPTSRPRPLRRPRGAARLATRRRAAREASP
ncbi:MAG: hypothetical protein ACK56I_35365, partial [bacterium]